MKILLVIFTLMLIAPNPWQIVSEIGPEPRYINQLVFAKDRLLLFGGKNSANSGFNDLWEWKDDKWKSLGKGATKRWDHSYTYMTSQDQLFLFGGRTFEIADGTERHVELNDSWVHNNQGWNRLEINGPGPRSSHSLGYSEKENRVILFGGRNNDHIYGDTWIFDGVKWSEIKIKGPRKRFGHSLTYDPQTETINLFGGYDGENLLNDFWVFSGDQWTEIHTKDKPSPRMAQAMQFDTFGNAILFGGWDDSNTVSGDLWIWTNDRWKMSNSEEMPRGRLSCAIGYNVLADEFILFGGSTGFDGQFLPETWQLNL